MKIIQLFNRRRFSGGEDRIVDIIENLLKKKGEQICTIRRSLDELGEGFCAKIKAFIFGIYSQASYRYIKRLINVESPEIIHVHNLYPQLTLSVLSACRDAGVPVVKHCHDHSLSCPITNHYRDKKICFMCQGGKEYWCVLKNCRKDIFESVAYATRSAIVRNLDSFRKNITLYIAISDYIKDYIIAQGYPQERIVTLPNPIYKMPSTRADVSSGGYVAYVGRLTYEKGIKTLLDTAKMLPNLPFRIAGNGLLMHEVIKEAPNNVVFLGNLDYAKLANFYRRARFLVVPSLSMEPFGLVAIEAMSHGLPVIASNIGGLPEVVDEGITGFLFEPDNSEQLASNIELLWNNIDLCNQMGWAGRKKALHEYSEDVYYKRLIAIYKKAIQTNLT